MLLLAALPILLLIGLLGFTSIPGERSCLYSLLAAVPLAYLGFDMPIADLLCSCLYGTLKAVSLVFIIIVMAIFSFNVLQQNGQMEVIKQMFTSITADKGTQVLLLTWGFGGLLEAVAGYGTSVAIPVAILISLGYKPLFAALVSLLANTMPSDFGAVGTPVTVLSHETGLAPTLLGTYIVQQLVPFMYLLPFTILWLTDRRRQALPKHLFLAFLTGTTTLVTQYLGVHYIGIESPAILSSLATLLTLTLYSRFFASRHTGVSPMPRLRQLGKAWLIYMIIITLIFAASPIFPGWHDWLNSHAVTRLTFSIGSQNIPFSVHWLTHCGVLLFVGTSVGGWLQGTPVRTLVSVLGTTLYQLRGVFVSLICLIILSNILNYAGMIGVLATAIASATGVFFPFFSPLLGCLGTFITGSGTTANILFGSLQAHVGSNLHISPDWLAASNMSGTTAGKLISPQSIAIVTSTHGLQGKDGIILRTALPYALVYVLMAGCLVWLGI